MADLLQMAMMLCEFFPQLANWNLTFIASDLSRDVLQRAKDGRYSAIEVNRGLPATMLLKYFTKVDSEWEISPQIRKMIDFREINLTEVWPVMPPLAARGESPARCRAADLARDRGGGDVRRGRS